MKKATVGLAAVALVAVILTGSSAVNERTEGVVAKEIRATEKHQESDAVIVILEKGHVLDYVYKDDMTTEIASKTLTIGYYLVQKDTETMSSIAKRLSLTEEFLMSVNADYEGRMNDKLEKFTLIKIPDADWNSISNVYCLTNSGNYLEQIAEYFYTSVEYILELNPDIKDGNLIYPNYFIKVQE